MVLDAKGRLEPDSELRDYENIPLKEDVLAFVAREVKPHVPDAWIAGIEVKDGKAVIVDEEKVRVGYEIPITTPLLQVTARRPARPHAR
jgi:type I restriction enzyme M protein